MKYFYYLLFFSSLLFASCNSSQENDEKNNLVDTIQTASGLQYYYIKKGEGRKIERGCEVGTYLSLMVNDSLVWKSDEGPDSLFTFIAGFTRLIKGFDEAAMLLRQGDEIVAILPDSIAYGAKGAGDVIPPYATLVYDKFRVVTVSEPKAILADTLFVTIKNKGFDAMLDEYKTIATSTDSTKYHLGTDQFYGLWYKLTNEEMHDDALTIATYFAKLTSDTWLRYYMVRSYENLGDIQQAIDSLKVIIKDNPDDETLKGKMLELEEKQKNIN